jgi:ABC-type transport system involved in cytochrome bd biosynthesis fused ATPase/permease subunit
MEILRVENLNFSYPLREEQALTDISFNVKEGEFIVVCGESGCGKTTLLKLIKRELAPCGGKKRHHLL